MTTEQKLAESMGIPYEIKQVSIGKHTINYLVAGSGPSLLLIHGANFGWGVWYPNIPVLAKYFTVYAIDLPGAGRSSRVDYRTLDPEKDVFNVVESFVRVVGLQKYSVCGCSIGGWAALRLAYKYPEDVEKAVVLNNVGFDEYMDLSDKVIGFYPLAWIISKTILKPSKTKNIESFLRGIFYDRNINLKREFIDYFIKTTKTSHNLLFISRLTKVGKSFLLSDILPEIKQKVLVIWGKEDKIIPLEKNRKNFQLIPNIHVELIEKTGHIPSLEDAEKFNGVFLKFFQQGRDIIE